MATRRIVSAGAPITTGPNTAEMLKAMRALLGLSQNGLAAKVGVTQQQISAYENHHNAISMITLADFATKTGVKVAVTFSLEKPSGKAAQD